MMKKIGMDAYMTYTSSCEEASFDVCKLCFMVFLVHAYIK